MSVSVPTYLYAEKNRDIIIISSMQLFTDPAELRKHFESRPTYADKFVWVFEGSKEARLLRGKALAELLK